MLPPKKELSIIFCVSVEIYLNLLHKIKPIEANGEKIQVSSYIDENQPLSLLIDLMVEIVFCVNSFRKYIHLNIDGITTRNRVDFKNVKRPLGKCDRAFFLLFRINFNPWNILIVAKRLVTT